MAIKISAIKPTTLKSILSSTATLVNVKEFKSRDNELITWAQLATDWIVLVIKQGDIWEQIKCDGLTQNIDGSATLNVATDGRHILPIPPYTGSATGFDFSLGEVVVSNDVLTSNSIVPDEVISYVDGEITVIEGELADVVSQIGDVQGEIDNLDALAVHKTGNEIIGGVKEFTQSPIVPTPINNNEVANMAYVLSVAFGGITLFSGFQNFSIKYDEQNRIVSLFDRAYLKTYFLKYRDSNSYIPYLVRVGSDSYYINFGKNGLIINSIKI